MVFRRNVSGGTHLTKLIPDLWFSLTREPWIFCLEQQLATSRRRLNTKYIQDETFGSVALTVSVMFPCVTYLEVWFRPLGSLFIF